MQETEESKQKNAFAHRLKRFGEAGFFFFSHQRLALADCSRADCLFRLLT